MDRGGPNRGLLLLLLVVVGVLVAGVAYALYLGIRNRPVPAPAVVVDLSNETIDEAHLKVINNATCDLGLGLSLGPGGLVTLNGSCPDLRPPPLPDITNGTYLFCPPGQVQVNSNTTPAGLTFEIECVDAANVTSLPVDGPDGTGSTANFSLKAIRSGSNESCPPGQHLDNVVQDEKGRLLSFTCVPDPAPFMSFGDVNITNNTNVIVPVNNFTGPVETSNSTHYCFTLVLGTGQVILETCVPWSQVPIPINGTHFSGFTYNLSLRDTGLLAGLYCTGLRQYVATVTTLQGGLLDNVTCGTLPVLVNGTNGINGTGGSNASVDLTAPSLCPIVTNGTTSKTFVAGGNNVTLQAACLNVTVTPNGCTVVCNESTVVSSTLVGHPLALELQAPFAAFNCTGGNVSCVAGRDTYGRVPVLHDGVTMLTTTSQFGGAVVQGTWPNLTCVNQPSVVAGTYGDIINGTTFRVPQITLNGCGTITSIVNVTSTIVVTNTSITIQDETCMTNVQHFGGSTIGIRTEQPLCVDSNLNFGTLNLGVNGATRDCQEQLTIVADTTSSTPPRFGIYDSSNTMSELSLGLWQVNASVRKPYLAFNVCLNATTGNFTASRVNVSGYVIDDAHVPGEVEFCPFDGVENVLLDPSLRLQRGATTSFVPVQVGPDAASGPRAYAGINVGYQGATFYDIPRVTHFMDSINANPRYQSVTYDQGRHLHIYEGHLDNAGTFRSSHGTTRPAFLEVKQGEFYLSNFANGGANASFVPGGGDVIWHAGTSIVEHFRDTYAYQRFIAGPAHSFYGGGGFYQFAGTPATSNGPLLDFVTLPNPWDAMQVGCVADADCHVSFGMYKYPTGANTFYSGSATVAGVALRGFNNTLSFYVAPAPNTTNASANEVLTAEMNRTRTVFNQQVRAWTVPGGTIAEFAVQAPAPTTSGATSTAAQLATLTGGDNVLGLGAYVSGDGNVHTGPVSSDGFVFYRTSGVLDLWYVGAGVPDMVQTPGTVASFEPARTSFFTPVVIESPTCDTRFIRTGEPAPRIQVVSVGQGNSWIDMDGYFNGGTHTSGSSAFNGLELKKLGNRFYWQEFDVAPVNTPYTSTGNLGSIDDLGFNVFSRTGVSNQYGMLSLLAGNGTNRLGFGLEFTDSFGVANSSTGMTGYYFSEDNGVFSLYRAASQGVGQFMVNITRIFHVNAAPVDPVFTFDVPVDLASALLDGTTVYGVAYIGPGNTIRSTPALLNGQTVIGRNGTFPTVATITGTLGHITVNSGNGTINIDLSNPMAVPGGFSNAWVYTTNLATLTTITASTVGGLLIGYGPGHEPIPGVITGTPNQVIVNLGAGTINLALTQDLCPTCSPTFATVNLTGGLSVGTLNVTGATILSSTLTVGGDTLLSGKLNVTGAVILVSTLAVGGDVTLSSKLNVSGATNLLGTLAVSGATNLLSTLAVTGAATFANTLNVSGATNLLGTLAVTGTGSFASTLNVSGATFLLTTLTVNGATNLLSTLSVTGAGTFANTLNVSGATNLLSTLAVTGAATFANTLNVSGATNLLGTLTVSGTGVFSTLNVTGATNLLSTLAVSGATTLASTLAVTGTGVFSSTLNVTGATNLLSTLVVTSTGRFLNTLNVSGATFLLSTLAVSGATTLSSTLAVTGVSTFATTVNVSGATNLLSTLAVTGTAVFSSTVNVSGTTFLLGTATVTGLATFKTGLVLPTAGSVGQTLDYFDSVGGSFTIGGGLSGTVNYHVSKIGFFTHLHIDDFSGTCTNLIVNLTALSSNYIPAFVESRPVTIQNNGVYTTGVMHIAGSGTTLVFGQVGNPPVAFTAGTCAILGQTYTWLS